MDFTAENNISGENSENMLYTKVLANVISTSTSLIKLQFESLYGNRGTIKFQNDGIRKSVTFVVIIFTFTVISETIIILHYRMKCFFILINMIGLGWARYVHI